MFPFTYAYHIFKKICFMCPFTYAYHICLLVETCSKIIKISEKKRHSVIDSKHYASLVKEFDSPYSLSIMPHLVESSTFRGSEQHKSFGRDTEFDSPYNSSTMPHLVESSTFRGSEQHKSFGRDTGFDSPYSSSTMPHLVESSTFRGAEQHKSFGRDRVRLTV